MCGRKLDVWEKKNTKNMYVLSSSSFILIIEILKTIREPNEKQIKLFNPETGKDLSHTDSSQFFIVQTEASRRWTISIGCVISKPRLSGASLQSS